MIRSNGGASSRSSLPMIASSDDDHEQWGRSFTKFAGGQSMQSGINWGQLFVGGGGGGGFFFGWLDIAKKLLIKCFLKISIAKKSIKI
jgi:hypothetical protein